MESQHFQTELAIPMSLYTTITRGKWHWVIRQTSKKSNEDARKVLRKLAADINEHLDALDATD